MSGHNIIIREEALVRDFTGLSIFTLIVQLTCPVPDMTYNVFGGTLSLTQPNPSAHLGVEPRSCQ